MPVEPCRKVAHAVRLLKVVNHLDRVAETPIRIRMALLWKPFQVPAGVLGTRPTSHPARFQSDHRLLAAVEALNA